MPWANRNGKRVFYESRRADGQPVKVYRGSGPAAEEAAAAVAGRRSDRVEQAERLAADVAAHAAASAPLAQLDELLDLVAKAALVMAGFRQHDRGAWRRTRDDRSQ